MGRPEDMTRRRKEAREKLLAAKPRVHRVPHEMERAVFSDGALLEEQEELIAVDILVAADRESCMQWHGEQAEAAGASQPEALEVVEGGIEMPGGPGMVSARFALEVMKGIFPKQLRPVAGCPNEALHLTGPRLAASDPRRFLAMGKGALGQAWRRGPSVERPIR